MHQRYSALYWEQTDTQNHTHTHTRTHSDGKINLQLCRAKEVQMTLLQKKTTSRKLTHIFF